MSGSGHTFEHILQHISEKHLHIDSHILIVNKHGKQHHKHGSPPD